MDEMIAHDLPGKAVVLQHPLGVRAHDLHILFMLQKLPDHARLRHDRQDAVGYVRVLRRADERLGKAGAIVVVDPNDAVLHGGRGLYRGIDRKVAALGVSADAQPRVRILARHAAKVFERARLGGDDLEVAHVQVLLPADDGIVRAAVGKIDAAVAQLDRQRRELLLARVVHQLAVAVQQHPAEAHGVRHTAHEVGDAPRDQHAHVDLLPVMAGEVGSRCVAQRHAAPQLRRRHDALKVDEAQLRQDQAVHLVER